LSIFDPDSQIAPLETGIVTIPSGGVGATASGVALTGAAYGSFSSQGDDQSNSAGTLLFNYQALTGAVSNASGVLSNITLSGGIQACAGGGGYVISSASFACVEGAATSSFSEILLFQQ
jgi:hypothetical protein